VYMITPGRRIVMNFLLLSTKASRNWSKSSHAERALRRDAADDDEEGDRS
jgi:hypothetical protein